MTSRNKITAFINNTRNRQRSRYNLDFKLKGHLQTHILRVNCCRYVCLIKKERVALRHSLSITRTTRYVLFLFVVFDHLVWCIQMSKSVNLVMVGWRTRRVTK